MSRRNDTPIQSIPEVAAFTETQARIRAFKESNPEFFRYWDELIADYNDKLTAADKVVRARGVSCGDWDRYQEATTYDAEYLYTRFGRESFLELGGKLETIEKRSVDKKRVDMAITAGRIPPEEAGQVKKVGPRYHAPNIVETPKI